MQVLCCHSNVSGTLRWCLHGILPSTMTSISNCIYKTPVWCSFQSRSHHYPWLLGSIPDPSTLVKAIELVAPCHSLPDPLEPSRRYVVSQLQWLCFFYRCNLMWVCWLGYDLTPVDCQANSAWRNMPPTPPDHLSLTESAQVSYGFTHWLRVHDIFGIPGWALDSVLWAIQ